MFQLRHRCQGAVRDLVGAWPCVWGQLYAWESQSSITAWPFVLANWALHHSWALYYSREANYGNIRGDWRSVMASLPRNYFGFPPEMRLELSFRYTWQLLLFPLNTKLLLVSKAWPCTMAAPWCTGSLPEELTAAVCCLPSALVWALGSFTHWQSTCSLSALRVLPSVLFVC